MRKSTFCFSKGLGIQALNTENPDDAWEYVRLIGKSLDKLDWILVTLYEVSVIRKGVVVIKEVNIEGIITSLYQNLSHVANYDRIKFTLVNELKTPFYSDEILIQTILRNILENAVKYSQLGILNPFVNVTLSTEGIYNTITIEDNGVGIKDDFARKIFDPFVRDNTDRKGSGLELYIVKNAIDKLGGNIELVKSEPHVGTVFKLQFPNQLVS